VGEEKKTSWKMGERGRHASALPTTNGEKSVKTLYNRDLR